MTASPVMQLGALAGALTASDRRGLLAALNEQPAAADELARRLELEPAGTGLVLEVLRTNGLLERRDGRYHVSPPVALELTGPLRQPGRATAFWGQMYDLLGGIRPQPGSHVEVDQSYSDVVLYLERMFAAPARTLAAALGPLIVDRPRARVLDVGAGSGVWSLELAALCPEARLTAVDLPRVAELFVRRSRERALEQRVDVITGDYFTVDLPEAAHDVVILGNVLHLESPDRAAALLARLRRTLKPDGLLVVVDMFGDGTEEGERLRSAYAVHLSLRVASGRPHPEPEVRDWLRRSGLGNCRHLDLPPLMGLAALVATADGSELPLLSSQAGALLSAPTMGSEQGSLSDEDRLRLRLATMERRLRHVWEQATEPMVALLRTTLGVLHANPTFVELFGTRGWTLSLSGSRSRAAIDLPPFLDLVLPEDRERVEAALNRVALDEARPDNPCSLRLLGRGGEVRECEMSLHYPPSGNSLIASIRDVTEQLNATRQIQRYTRELEQANHQLRETQAQVLRQAKLVALARLVAGVTHELNTPLGTLRSGADTISRAAGQIRDSLPEAAGKLWRAFSALDQTVLAVDQATTRISQVVGTLKRFARLDEAPVQPVDLNHAVDSVLDLLVPGFPAGVEVRRDPGDVPLVTCQADEINQALTNLLLNAVDAIDDQGTVTVCTWATDSQVLVSVADSGRGIPDSDLEHIFEPGFTTRGVGVGVGLGLPIAARIINEHQGRIDVSSAEGEGTTFVMRLPLQQD